MDHNLNKEIADFIRKKRRQKNKTQKDIAKHLGKSESTIRNIENGRSSINVEDLFKILKYLGCDKYELKMIIYRIYFVLDSEDAMGSLEYAVLAIGLIGVIIILYSVAT